MTDGDDVYLLSLIRAWQYLQESRLSAEGDKRPVSQPLLMTVRLKLNREERESLRQWRPYLEHTGIQFTQDVHGVVFSGVPAMIREQPLTSLLGRLAEWLSGSDEPDGNTDSAGVSRWLAANCECAGVKDMTGLAVLCGQLQEVPETLMSKDGRLKAGLLTQIPLEEYMVTPASD
ncbi:hypothetical protein OP853_002652 [Salmonella enterica]|nr:hypothetical protein [Salmonella enterica]